MQQGASTEMQRYVGTGIQWDAGTGMHSREKPCLKHQRSQSPQAPAFMPELPPGLQYYSDPVCAQKDARARRRLYLERCLYSERGLCLERGSCSEKHSYSKKGLCSKKGLWIEKGSHIMEAETDLTLTPESESDICSNLSCKEHAWMQAFTGARRARSCQSTGKKGKIPVSESDGFGCKLFRMTPLCSSGGHASQFASRSASGPQATLCLRQLCLPAVTTVWTGSFSVVLLDCQGCSDCHLAPCQDMFGKSLG